MKKKIILSKILFFFLLFYSEITFSQQYFTIDKDYPTGNSNFKDFTDAITFLNALTNNSSPIVFNVKSGQIFNEEVPILEFVATKEADVTFVKYGDGANPKIVPTVEVATGDGAIFIQSSAYITFDGIDVNNENYTTDIKVESGYYITYSNNITIKNCNVVNFSKYGVYSRYGSNNVTVDNCNIYFTDDYFAPNDLIYGLYSNFFSAKIENINFTNNKIWGLKIDPLLTNNTIYCIRHNRSGGVVANNFISILNDNDKISAIRVDASGTTDYAVTNDIYHNTVLLQGNTLKETTALYTTGTLGTINFKNNIIVNNLISESTDIAQIIFWITTAEIASPELNFDDNMYYCSDSENAFECRWGPTTGFFEFTSLEEWSETTGKDKYSRIYNPNFVNPAIGDLHLSDAMLGNFIFASKYIVSVPSDIDKQLRDLEFTYLGADENMDYPLNIHVTTDPNLLEFNDIFINYTEELTFDIVNAGTNSATVENITFSQSDLPFVMSLDGQNYLNELSNIIIDANNQQTVYLKFIPEVLAEYNFIVKLNLNNGQLLELPMVANSVPSTVEISNYLLDFGELHVNNYSEIKNIIVKNISQEELIIQDIVAPEGYFIRKKGDLEWINYIDEFTIPFQGLQEIEIVFMPVKQNNYNNSLYINISQLEIAISLLGEGLELDFDISELGETMYYGSTAIGDIDKDGDLDIVMSGYSGDCSILNIYQNNSNFEFTKLTHSIEPIGAGTINLIDVDNDADLDLFVTGQRAFGVQISLLYTNENGNFTLTENNFETLEVPSSDWADFNGDGLLDLVITGGDDADGVDIAHLIVYRNLGDAKFVKDITMAGVKNGKVKCTDYDNDGDADFVVSGRIESNYAATMVYRNDNYVFTEAALLFGGKYCSIDCADYDNDGDMDLLVTGSVNTSDTDFLPAVSRIYRNDGNDVFTDVVADIPAVQYGDMKWVDVNQDGLLDIAANGIYSYDEWIGGFYINRGNNVFEKATFKMEELKYPELQFADLDGDLDLDMVFT